MKKLKTTIFSKTCDFIRRTLGIDHLIDGVYASNEKLAQLNDIYINSFSDSAIKLFILSNYQHLNTGHYHKHYQEWRMRKLRKVLQIYDIDYFSGKNILELGGGLGDIGAFFAELGANVLSVEGRKINSNFANIKYRHLKNFKSIVEDIEHDFTHLGKFDLVIAFSILEVAKNIDNVMACCAKISDNILLETMVCDSLDPAKIIYVEMDNEETDNPISGVSSRPSPAYVENFFSNRGFSVYRYFDKDLNTLKHCYDWKHRNDNSVGDDSMRRFWHFKKERS